MRFGEFLIEKQIIGQVELDAALDAQRYCPGKLGRILKQLGILSEAALNRELSRFLLVSSNSQQAMDLEALKAEIQKSVFEKTYFDFSIQHDVIAIRKSDETTVLFSTSFRDEVLEQAEAIFRGVSEFSIVDESVFLYLRSVIQETGGQKSGFKIDDPVSDEKKIAAHDPYTSFFRTMVLQAQEMGASDIHVEPMRSGVDLRFRVDGDLLLWRTLGFEHRRSFLNEVKRLVNLDIALSGFGQDARVSLRQWGLDLRVSLTPTQYGEKITLRLLDLNRKFELSAIGFDEETSRALAETLKLNHGVILISGPTGSGKTTTLYSLLCSLDRKVLNIMTLEDPIEYSIDGLVQVPITKKFSFSDALRTALRQDPDVILVGEIRDAETADLCMKAASTGHLVFSTLHANGAAEVVDRLLGLGVEKHLLKSVLRFSSAQRLLQKLCSHCALPFDKKKSGPNGDSLENLSLYTRNPEGCEHCRRGTPGVQGRVPILEYMGEAEIGAYLTSPNEKPKRQMTLLRAGLKRAEKGEVDYESTLAIA